MFCWRPSRILGFCRSVHCSDPQLPTHERKPRFPLTHGEVAWWKGAESVQKVPCFRVFGFRFVAKGSQGLSNSRNPNHISWCFSTKKLGFIFLDLRDLNTVVSSRDATFNETVFPFRYKNPLAAALSWERVEKTDTDTNDPDDSQMMPSSIGANVISMACIQSLLDHL